MREGDKTITTSIPSIMGSKDPDASSSQVYDKLSKEAKDMNKDQLVDLLVLRLNPQTKNATPKDNPRNAHLYPRWDMVGCIVCSRNHPSNVQGYVQDNKPYGVDIVLDGEIMKHHNVDILECFPQHRHKHINRGRNN